MPRPRILLLFTKPARPGKVKTRLVSAEGGGLSAEQAAALHEAFLDDLSERLAPAVAAGELALRVAWALEEGEEIPDLPAPLRGLAAVDGVRQRGADLGERMFHALAEASAGGAPSQEAPEGAPEEATVAVVGSDHPTLPLDRVREAFRRVEEGADGALGPAEDGGYYLLALAPHAVRRRLFEGIAWSTGEVLGETLARCRELGLEMALLPRATDVDEPADLVFLAALLAAEEAPACRRTRELLTAWGRLPAPAPGLPASSPGASPGTSSGASRGTSPGAPPPDPRRNPITEPAVAGEGLR